MENISKYDYSKRISKSRNHGKIEEAIKITLEAKEKYPKENIFEKFLGDLYFQKKNYEAAGAAYMEFLIKINDNVEYVKHFAQFLKRYSEVVQNISDYLTEIQKILDTKIQNQDVIAAICEIISHYIKLPQITLFENDINYDKAIKYLHKVENTSKIYILFYKVLAIKHGKADKKISKSVVSFMEKKNRYKEALNLIVDILVYDQDKVNIRTLFRICRKLDDYSEAEKYIAEHPDIKTQSEFNILYELVFYYSKTGNNEDRNNALKKIEVCGQNSVPIMRTLYNFYLQFGMINKTMEIKAFITKKQKSETRSDKNKENRDRKQQEDDAAEALVATMRELFTEIEHSRKLISMSELLKGFSHELGQPITNIRFGVQLFQMKMARGDKYK